MYYGRGLKPVHVPNVEVNRLTHIIAVIISEKNTTLNAVKNVLLKFKKNKEAYKL